MRNTCYLVSHPSFISLYRCHSDPLISHRHHFCWTVNALCNVKALLTNGILWLGELAEEPEEVFTTEWALDTYSILHVTYHGCRERQEHCIFGILLQMVPGLETQLMEGDKDEVIHVAELVSVMVLFDVCPFNILTGWTWSTSFRKVCQPLDWMTQRVSKELCSTG